LNRDSSRLILKQGREVPIERRHPWIFSGAVAKISGNPKSGETVQVFSDTGDALGSACFSPSSKIRARMWSWDPQEEIDKDFFEAKLRIAINTRKILLNFSNASTNAYRLIYAESDFLPGLIVDIYANFLVVQYLSTGAEYWRGEIADVLEKITGIKNIYERSDVEARRLEGLTQNKGVIKGEQPPVHIEINENGLRFLVDISHGQKTGFYIDQRVNRKKILNYTKGKNILDCFCYTGAFTVYAIQGKAKHITSIDSSSEVLALAIENCSLNYPNYCDLDWIKGNVFQELRKFRDSNTKFDLIVLDPPKFAPTARQAQRGARGYKDINLLAFKLLNPSGILFTFSCSGGVSSELFQKIVAGAALDAGVKVQILEKLHQSPDHPVGLHFPEGEYLKGLICRII